MNPVLAYSDVNPYLCTPAAQVAELADALGSGPSARKGVQVRFLSWASVKPYRTTNCDKAFFIPFV
jgi:hypothetical protein